MCVCVCYEQKFLRRCYMLLGIVEHTHFYEHVLVFSVFIIQSFEVQRVISSFMFGLATCFLFLFSQYSSYSMFYSVVIYILPFLLRFDTFIYFEKCALFFCFLFYLDSFLSFCCTMFHLSSTRV